MSDRVLYNECISLLAHDFCAGVDDCLYDSFDLGKLRARCLLVSIIVRIRRSRLSPRGLRLRKTRLFN